MFSARLPPEVFNALRVVQQIVAAYAAAGGSENVASKAMFEECTFVADGILLLLRLTTIAKQLHERAKAGSMDTRHMRPPPLIDVIPDFGAPGGFIHLDSSGARQVIRFFEATMDYKPGERAAGVIKKADSQGGPNASANLGLEAMLAQDSALAMYYRLRGIELSKQLDTDGVSLHVKISVASLGGRSQPSQQARKRVHAQDKLRAGADAAHDFLSGVNGLYADSCLAAIGLNSDPIVSVRGERRAGGVLTHLYVEPIGGRGGGFWIRAADPGSFPPVATC